MNLIKTVLSNEVYPALGCTEPISCAYAAAVASSYLGEPVESFVLRIDPGTYKNGAAVTVPHAGGAKGNLIAAALGAVLADGKAKLELLGSVTPPVEQRAKQLVDGGCGQIECLHHKTDFHVDVQVRGATHTGRCVLDGGHTRVVLVEHDGVALKQVDGNQDDETDEGSGPAYREELARLDVSTLLALVDDLDDEDFAYLRRGIEMNLAMAEKGLDVGQTAFHLRRMRDDGYLAEDLFFRTKLRVAAAVDARMAGVARPVMTSGGSGNQGVVAILTPYEMGTSTEVDEQTVLRSIAVAHLLNAYIKCFVGELSVICGCAMAAGIAAAVAIVYQRAGADLEKITLAVNNVIGDLSGLICDGAKPGCALKTVSAVDSAMRSGLMALEGYGLSIDDGLVGRSVEESIRNLRRITLEGMLSVDPTVLKILQEKAPKSGKA